jgi:hypothetical protein
MTLPLSAERSPGSWLLSQPQLLFFLLVAVVWLLNVIKRMVGVAAAPKAQGEAAAEGPGEDERTRRVREEILRKITERQLGSRTAVRAENERRALVAQAAARAAQDYGRVLREKEAAAVAQSLQERLADLQGSAPTARPAGSVVAAPAPSAGSVWLGELRTRDAVRRAIVAREILGPPVALR